MRTIFGESLDRVRLSVYDPACVTYLPPVIQHMPQEIEPSPESAAEALSPRQREIVRLVSMHGFATIETLARQFDVSAQTVRRDIIRLDELGVLQRFHGGAGARQSTTRLGYAQKQTLSAEAKERIAAEVAEMVPSGSSLFLDVGTTVEAVARALRDHREMHVVTNSLSAAAILSNAPVGDVFVTGGMARGPDGSLVGDATQAGIGQFRLDLAVIGCSGFDEESGAPMDFDLLKVAAKRAMIAQSRRAMLVADASKFTRSAIVRIAGLEEVSVLVSDEPPPEHLRRLATEAGCRVCRAQPSGRKRS